MGGIGPPASYALAKYLDRWFRHGETPPAMTRTFWAYAREQAGRSILMGVILQAAAVVIAVNLMSLTDWYLRAANLGGARAPRGRRLLRLLRDGCD